MRPAALEILLAAAMRAIGAAEQGNGAERLNEIAHGGDSVSLEAREEMPSWLIVEITPRAEVMAGRTGPQSRGR